MSGCRVTQQTQADCRKLRAKIEQNRQQYEHIFVAYADCGTGGEIDRLIGRRGHWSDLPGAHCYSFFAGEQRFTQMAEQELGSFYLTDFLVEHFDRLVIRGLKLDRHPELREQYFAHYSSWFTCLSGRMQSW